jgi:hypothetical protein
MVFVLVGEILVVMDLQELLVLLEVEVGVEVVLDMHELFSL